MKKIENWDNKSLIAQTIIARLDIDLLNENSEYRKEILDIVSLGIGGFCIFSGSPESVEKTTSYLQSLSEIPLFFCADFENGLQMRLSEGTSFPHAMAIGNTDNPENAYKIGNAIAKESKQIGIHWNLAPVCDINNNKNNPVINIRSFGEDKSKVSIYAKNYVQGTQKENVLACGKHFPGHGDTDTDSHLTLPVLNFDKDRIFDFELEPFRALIESDVKSIMTGHLAVPSLDNTMLPASLSREMISVLKNDLNFEGLVITDALDMKAISEKYSSGQAVCMALDAGNDIALMPKDVKAAINFMIDELEKNNELKVNIISSVNKIIKMKRWVGILPYFAKNDETQNTFINHINLALKIAVDSIKINGDKSLLPLNEQINFSSLAFLQNDKDFQSASRFFTMLAQATENDCDFAFVNHEISDEDLNAIVEGMKDAEVFIAVMFYKSIAYHGSVKVEERVLEIIDRVRKGKKMILIIFGNPYLKDFIDSDLTIDMFSDSFSSLAAAVVKISGRESLVKI